MAPGTRRRPLGPSVVAVAVVASLASLAACSVGGDIRIEQADAIADVAEAPATTEGSPGTGGAAPPGVPSTTEAPPTTQAPPTTERPTPSSGTVGAPPPEPGAARPPETGVGDPLFPELGSSDLDVESYVVRLDATDPAGELTGSVELTASVPTDVNAIALDADGPMVDRVLVDGATATFSVDDGELLVDAAPAQVADGEVRIVVDYRVTPQQGVPSSVGLPVGWIVDGDGAYVLNQPDGASSWLPSSDHPSDRATWRFEIDAAAGRTVSANGALVSRPPPGDGGTWVWEQGDSMPTYLVHLVVGDYELLDGGTVTSVTGRRIPLTHLVPSGRADDFARAIETVPDRIAFFEQRFGAYPLERYGLAFVDGLSGLAMETQGRSLFGADDFAGLGTGFVQELLLSHELAHQWFGNAVTPAEWDDLWLNESMATYAQWLWLDHRGMQPLDRWAQRMLDERGDRTVDATGDPVLDNLFGFERYDGGAVVLHALRSEIGDDAFFELLSSWVADNLDTARTTEDFTGLAEAVSGRPLGAFFDAWLFSVQPPAAYPS